MIMTRLAFRGGMEGLLILAAGLRSLHAGLDWAGLDWIGYPGVVALCGGVAYDME